MRRWMKPVVISAAAVLALTGWGLTNAHADNSDSETIPEGIHIGAVAVGGMTEDEAANAVRDYVESISGDAIILTATSGKTLTTSIADLGMAEDVEAAVEEAVNYGKSGNLIGRYKDSKDLQQEDIVLPLFMTLDKEKASAWLESHVDEVNQEAVDYGLTRENDEFVIIEGADGVTVDVPQSIDAVEAYFSEGWTDGANIDLVCEVTQPRGTKEEIEKIQDKLGSFATDYSSSASGRKKNVANGADKINGSIVYPGDTFSVYEAVSPFNAENGYALAGAFENGTTVEAYGGGICQVSTTLYNAVIRAELEVVERSGHSMIVNYVDPSADAAIAGTIKDFKFKNNLDAPIYIEGYTDGGTIRFTVYGQETRPENREVSFVSETTSTTQPTVEYRATGAGIGYFSKVQSSHTGKTAQLWKIVTVDGVEQSREIFNKTTYNMSPTIYEVGTGSSNGEASAAMKAAVASQNEGTIKAAMAQWNDAALQKAAEEKAAAEAEAQAAAEAQAQAAAQQAAQQAQAQAAQQAQEQAAQQAQSADTTQNAAEAAE